MSSYMSNALRVPTAAPVKSRGGVRTAPLYSVCRSYTYTSSEESWKVYIYVQCRVAGGIPADKVKSSGGGGGVIPTCQICAESWGICYRSVPSCGDYSSDTACKCVVCVHTIPVGSYRSSTESWEVQFVQTQCKVVCGIPTDPVQNRWEYAYRPKARWCLVCFTGPLQNR